VLFLPAEKEAGGEDADACCGKGGCGESFGLEDVLLYGVCPPFLLFIYPIRICGRFFNRI